MKIVYKNPYIFSYELLKNTFYVVVNPVISDGMIVLNKIQKLVLDQIDNFKKKEDIFNELNILESDFDKIITYLKSCDIVSYENKFNHFLTNKTEQKSINVWVHTTNSCTIACKYCYIHKDVTHMKEDVYDEFYRKLLELVRERGIKKVTLRMAGGEPTTRLKYFKSFVDKLKVELEELSCEFRLVFLTSLTYMTDEILNFIKDYKVSISTSLDGLEEYNDTNRVYANGKGTFNKVESNINLLRDNKIGVFVNVTITNENLDGLLELTKYLVSKKLGFRYSFVNDVYLDQFKLSKVLEECYDFIEDNLDKYPNFAKKHRLADLKFENPVDQACGSGRNTFLLNTDGNIHYCAMALQQNKIIGSVYNDDDLITQVSSQKAFTPINTCYSCNYRYICAGGCPVEMQNGKSPFCDIFHKFIPIIIRLKAKQKLMKIIGKEKYSKMF